jgi:hypothetical protein
MLQQVDAPIIASVDIRGPNYGFHVEAQWPPRLEELVDSPETEPIHPVKILGVTIDQAIPLSTPSPER